MFGGFAFGAGYFGDYPGGSAPPPTLPSPSFVEGDASVQYVSEVGASQQFTASGAASQSVVASGDASRG